MWPLEDSVVIERFSQSVQAEDGLTYFSSYFFNSEAFICSLSLFKKIKENIRLICYPDSLEFCFNLLFL